MNGTSTAMVTASPPSEHRVLLLGAMDALMWDERGAEVVLDGPYGTGKTRGILEYVHRTLLSHHGVRALILPKTLTSLTASALVTYAEFVLRPGEATYFGGSGARPAAYEYPSPGSPPVLR